MTEVVRLGDLITLQRGFDITEKEQNIGTVPVISSGGIFSYHNKFKVKGPGVVIGRKGTLGKVFYTSENYWPHDTSLWVKNFKGNDPKFIFYLLKILRLEKFDAGAANPSLNRNHVHSLKLSVPEKKYRSKIATILSDYDELIENNNQRIKLLEEMTEEIYKEWFVRMRFPGYETKKYFNKDGDEVFFNVTDSLPEGWQFVKLAEEFKKIVLGGTPSRSIAKYWKDGTIDWIQSGKLNDLRIITGSEKITKEAVENSATEIMPPKTVLIAITGAIIVGFSEINLCANQSVVGIYGSEDLSQEYLFLEQKHNQFYYISKMTGSAQQHINKDVVQSYTIVKPDSEVIKLFDKIIKPMFEEVKILLDKNLLLQQTRDLLLPRLISGKLSVEHLTGEVVHLPMAAEPEVTFNTKSSS